MRAVFFFLLASIHCQQYANPDGSIVDANGNPIQGTGSYGYGVQYGPQMYQLFDDSQQQYDPSLYGYQNMQPQQFDASAYTQPQAQQYAQNPPQQQYDPSAYAQPQQPQYAQVPIQQQYDPSVYAQAQAQQTQYASPTQQPQQVYIPQQPQNAQPQYQQQFDPSPYVQNQQPQYGPLPQGQQPAAYGAVGYGDPNANAQALQGGPNGNMGSMPQVQVDVNGNVVPFLSQPTIPQSIAVPFSANPQAIAPLPIIPQAIPPLPMVPQQLIPPPLPMIPELIPPPLPSVSQPIPPPLPMVPQPIPPPLPMVPQPIPVSLTSDPNAIPSLPLPPSPIQDTASIQAPLPAATAPTQDPSQVSLVPMTASTPLSIPTSAPTPSITRTDSAVSLPAIGSPMYVAVDGKIYSATLADLTSPYSRYNFTDATGNSVPGPVDPNPGPPPIYVSVDGKVLTATVADLKSPYSQYKFTDANGNPVAGPVDPNPGPSPIYVAVDGKVYTATLSDLTSPYSRYNFTDANGNQVAGPVDPNPVASQSHVSNTTVFVSINGVISSMQISDLQTPYSQYTFTDANGNPVPGPVDPSPQLGKSLKDKILTTIRAIPPAGQAIVNLVSKGVDSIKAGMDKILRSPDPVGAALTAGGNLLMNMAINKVDAIAKQFTGYIKAGTMGVAAVGDLLNGDTDKGIHGLADAGLMALKSSPIGQLTEKLMAKSPAVAALVNGAGKVLNVAVDAIAAGAKLILNNPVANAIRDTGKQAVAFIGNVAGNINKAVDAFAAKNPVLGAPLKAATQFVGNMVGGVKDAFHEILTNPNPIKGIANAAMSLIKASPIGQAATAIVKILPAPVKKVISAVTNVISNAGNAVAHFFHFW